VLPLARTQRAAQLKRVRIYQDEIYHKGEKFIRIVRLDRYEVEFKTMQGDPKGEGTVTTLVKKEFCRLLKGMALMPLVKKTGDAE
jgi:hypothetical protein